MPEDIQEEYPNTNRDRKTAGRSKRRRHVQGTRAFTHAMTNRMARRAAEMSKTGNEEDKRGSG